MLRTTPLLLAAAIALLACGGQTEAPAPAKPESGSAERKIYIDPETGERLSEPPESEQPSSADRTSGSKRSPEIIEREDGSSILIHEPEDWPELKARKQPDGSVVIEHPGESQ
ncbi:hypothetical protein [Spectribacter hydrogenoxidans]|uniref:Secreted protein n=1 Tax=Spectribacter hydrogenoxidans TaxID=3075608 RepID=A0ABU3C191_9GAMM|nr:hypothetical protein [Salinisphaera sp. W335]MDT0635325.1 hypothetical protein [Salinisphaera sp. W335]